LFKDREAKHHALLFYSPRLSLGTWHPCGIFKVLRAF